MDNTRKSDVYQRWDDGFIVRRMRSDESHQVIKWISADRSVCYELQVLLEMCGENVDVDDFFMGELNGESVASLAVAPVADDLIYYGHFYVAERHRCTGFARRMITAAYHVEQRRNFNGIVCITTIPDMESMFAKFNGETTIKLTRFVGVVSTDVNRSGYGTDVMQVLEMRNNNNNNNNNNTSTALVLLRFLTQLCKHSTVF